MRRTVSLSCLYLLLTAVAPALAQQQRLFAVMPNEVVELDSRAASLGTVLRRFPVPAAPAGSGTVSFGGGEFLAWVRAGGVALMNTRNGAVQQFSFPDFVATGVLGTDGNARLVVGGSNASGRSLVLVADARSGNVRVQDVGGPAETRGRAYAPAGDVLFVSRPIEIIFGQELPRLVDVFQASTGALIKTLDVSPIPPFDLTANAAGTRLFVSDGGSGTQAFDVVSGAQLASQSDPALQELGGIVLDERRNRLLAHVGPGRSEYQDIVGISAFAADSLQLLGRAPVPELPLPPATPDEDPSLTQQIDVSGQSATLFVLQAVRVAHDDTYITTTCHESRLMALDAATGNLRRTVSTTATLGAGACVADLVRITEPAAPVGLTADVSGSRVTLQWQAALDATAYQLEAGTASGLANAATISVTDTRLVVDAVPSGIYYVRVRAINSITSSAASQEVKVVVP